MIVKQINLVSTLGNLYIIVWKLCIPMLGRKGLKNQIAKLSLQSSSLVNISNVNVANNDVYVLSFISEGSQIQSRFHHFNGRLPVQSPLGGEVV